MKLFHILTTGGALAAASTSAFAHGNHAALPFNSLLHLLVHHWPLLLGSLILATVAALLAHRRN